MELNAVAQALRDDRLQRMIRGAGLPERPVDPSEIRVEPRARGRRREQITGRGVLFRKNHVEIVLPEGLVNAMRADITEGRRKSAGQLALEIDVPLHYVITFRVELGVIGAKSSRAASKLLECSGGK